jgi:hypothetical protein
MTFRLPDERVPEDEPWKNKDFLSHCYHDEGLSSRTIAFELGVEVSRVTVYAERLGIIHPHRHEPTLRRLHSEEGLSPEEISARDRFDCSPVTVRKHLARYDLIDDNPDDITYGRLDRLGSESPTPTP